MSTNDLFARMREEIPGFTAAAAGSYENDGYATTTTSGKLDLAEVRPALRALVAAFDAVHKGLGGAMELGSNDELLLSASRGYLLIKVNHERRRFVAVLLESSGNIGYLRFRMRDYLRRAVQEA